MYVMRALVAAAALVVVGCSENAGARVARECREIVDVAVREGTYPSTSAASMYKTCYYRHGIAGELAR